MVLVTSNLCRNRFHIASIDGIHALGIRKDNKKTGGNFSVYPCDLSACPDQNKNVSATHRKLIRPDVITCSGMESPGMIAAIAVWRGITSTRGAKYMGDLQRKYTVSADVGPAIRCKWLQPHRNTTSDST